jgi:hypothetical protein
MNRKTLLVLASSLLTLVLSPALLHAQGGPGPGGPPPFGGPRGGRGPGGFRVVGVEGCLTDGRPVPAGTPGVAATITHDRKEATFSGSVDHSSTETFYRDANGVTFTEITLPPMGSSKTSKTVICINDPNEHVRLVVDPANTSAREYKIPTPKSPSNSGPRPQFRNGQKPPNGGTNPNVTVVNPPAALPGAVTTDISSYCADAKTTEISRKAPDGTDTNERTYCPSLFLELHAQNSDARGITTTTAAISAATNSGNGNLGNPPIAYPLPSGYHVTVVTPGGRGRRNFQNQGGQQ